ncbi:MAG: hypothetical protein P4N60_20185 [Verrucomicrobiae bacterium]|nr:hypothetical protein [Verrucomicrobiae bacterium]
MCAKPITGEAEKQFRIGAGDRGALTPPPGWSSWNCWGDAVSQEKVCNPARAMVEKGLNEHGWTCVNIEDGWRSKRARGFDARQPNKEFPDRKKLVDEIHVPGIACYFCRAVTGLSPILRTVIPKLP